MENKWPVAAFSAETRARVAAANVLMVGAGGIGCELVKTLVLTGFRNITMVDMDTIEISNLNRQFLFRKHHVGQSKSKVAAEAVMAFCPDASITTLQDNVKDSKFDLDFFKQFDMVLNGLDNDEARRHVNRLCLATGTPLVESGTMGYRGQVSVHLKDESECYECVERPKPKGYPVCTIRNTPDKPIHCVVWAKDLLFARLFGPPDAITDLDEVQEKDGEEKPEEDADTSQFLRGEGEDAWQYALRVFDKVYNADIQRLLGMDELWKTHARPQAIALASLLPALERPELPPSATQASKVLGLDPRTDDDLAVDFVTAASNLRSHCYNISLQSQFTVKGMAGNIIHAIATTNAIISGMIVVEALKLVAGCKDAARKTFLMDSPNDYGKVMQPSSLAPPNPKCMVCSQAMVTLRVNTDTFTLKHFVDSVLKKAMAFNAPSIVAGDFLYEEGDDLDADEVEEHAAHLPKPLSSLPGGGIKHSTQVCVTDQTQELNVTIIVHHQEINAEEQPECYILEGSNPVNAVVADPDIAGPHAAPGDDKSDFVEVVTEPSAARGTKRKAIDPSAPSTSKSARTDAPDDAVIDLS